MQNLRDQLKGIDKVPVPDLWPDELPVRPERDAGNKRSRFAATVVGLTVGAIAVGVLYAIVPLFAREAKPTGSASHHMQFARGTIAFVGRTGAPYGEAVFEYNLSTHHVFKEPSSAKAFVFEPTLMRSGALAFRASNGEGDASIYTIRRSGDSPRLVGGPHLTLATPVWSPDGRSLAATSVVGSPFGGVVGKVVLLDSSGALLTMTPSERLYSGINFREGPSWSPDGSTITFAAMVRDRYQIWAVEVDGSKLRQLVSVRDSVHCPVWSADGADVAFVGKRGLYDLDVHTGVTSILVHGGNLLSCPAWSPDGSQIAYATGTGETVSIHDVGVDTHAQSALASFDVTGPNEPTDFGCPVWSNEGDHVVYATPDGLRLVGRNGSMEDDVPRPDDGATPLCPIVGA
jgi:Tol biopolymer transport system component